ncbi:MAG TPA: uroporphyrinogen decarboxylase [Symbiobacteriaceae bacterium]
MGFNDRLLRACRREPVDRTPVWFMRQAGRYQPEYRSLKERYSLFEICEQPELCAQVTMLPVEQLGVDAAILFSDIMTPVRGMGVDVALNPGPVMARPIRTMADVEALRPLVVEESIPYVPETIRILVRELKVPLIGFAGAPFTLASYMVEGGPSKHYLVVKRMMYEEPAIWSALMEKLTVMTVDYLLAQIRAGCQVVQLFDSWVGNLTVEDYERYVKPYTARVAKAVREAGAFLIHFGFGTGHLLPSMASVGVDVQGVDWKEPLDQAWARIGYDVGVQGNLDPAALYAPAPILEEKVKAILRRAQGRPGHIFNLGHGVLPTTPMDALKRVVEIVHSVDPQEVGCVD